MADENVKVCDLPMDERQDLILLFRQCRLTGSVMTMTKAEAEKLINEAMSGGGNKQLQPEEPVSSQIEAAPASAPVASPTQQQKAETQSKSNKTVAKNEAKVGGELLKCPRCYSLVKGKKCNVCGLKF